VKSLLLKSLIAAALVAAVLVPTASATSAPVNASTAPQANSGLRSAASSSASSRRVNVGLLPLAKSALGSPAASLELMPGSGAQSDQEAAWEAGVSPKKIKKMGRLTGYRLIYGSIFNAGNGLDELQTSVDEYKTSRDAKKALPFWKKLTLTDTTGLTQMNLVATQAAISVPRIGSRRWALLDTFSVTGVTPIYYLSEEFSDGPFVVDVVIAADSESAAKAFAKKTAGAVNKRIQRALAGHLHGKVIKGPGAPKVGPPASGPDPKTLTLTDADFPLSQVQQEGYDWLPSALSTYDVIIAPAGSFDVVFQSVSLMQSQTSAVYAAAFNGAEELAAQLYFAGAAFTQVTPVDLTTVGDGAQGAILEISGGGQTLYEAVVTLNTSSVADTVIADSSAAVSAQDVRALAQKAADRLNTGLGG
jgi:hypothetical protein